MAPARRAWSSACWASPGAPHYPSSTAHLSMSDVAWCRMAHRGRSKEIRTKVTNGEKYGKWRVTNGNGHESGCISSRHLNALTVTFWFREFSAVPFHHFWRACSFSLLLKRLHLFCRDGVRRLFNASSWFIMIYLYHNHNAVYRDPAVSALLQHLNPRHAFIIIHQINGRATSDESFWRISSNCFS